MAEELNTLIDEVVDASEAEIDEVSEHIVAEKNEDDLALLLESLPLEERLALWAKVPADQQVSVLVEMRSAPRQSIFDGMEPDALDALLTGVNAEDLIELSEDLPPALLEKALVAMDEQQQQFFEGAQKYDDDLAGHWVNHDLLLLPANARVRDALRLVRRSVPYLTDHIFLITRSGRYGGAVPLTSLFKAIEHESLHDYLNEELEPVTADTDSFEAARTILSSGFAALPVVDEEERILGRLDVDVASELATEHYENQLMSSAGLNEDEDLFAPVMQSAKGRGLWLFINLLTAFLASWFIGLFEATIAQVVALAVLMPVVASMGGIAGSQTLTLIIRGLALGQVSRSNLSALMKKELKVGLVNGVTWAIFIGITASFWFEGAAIGIVIALAILTNIVAAAFSGVIVPVVLDKLNLDPALSGSVILTTVTDIVGFVSFLGLGTLFLL